MSTTLNNQIASSYEEEPDLLMGELRTWGINYLMGSSPANGSSDGTTHQMPTGEFIKRLVQCEYPRIRDAAISLFLLHAELADVVQEVYQTSDVLVAEQVAVLVLATLYLQRLWSFQLAVVLGHTSCFPEQPFAHLWQHRLLPSPACHYGNVGLEALQAAEQQRRRLPLHLIGDWQNQIQHLLLQEAGRHRCSELPVPLFTLQNEEEQECGEMSMRHTVTKVDIEQFLNVLGKNFRKPGRLYLVGGAALVHMGLRGGSTLDIDVVVESANEDEMVTAIRRIVDQAQINIEFASPEDFIPIPAQWTSQARYIGRYGSVDVFYFDFYSIALSKIARGTDRDLVDVKLLVQQQVIMLAGLDAAYTEVLPRMGKRPYINLDPQRFTERYRLVRQQLEQLASGGSY